eukprot:7301031-Alexandrium_andersonii.AAC.1
MYTGMRPRTCASVWACACAQACARGCGCGRGCECVCKCAMRERVPEFAANAPTTLGSANN